LDKGENVEISEITEDLVKTDTDRIEPQKENFPIYDILQQRFNSLWKTLEGEFAEHRLSVVR
jgi:hypothetical protein